MGKNLLFQKPVVSKFGLFYTITWLICQKFGLFFETTGFETTGFSPYRLLYIMFIINTITNTGIITVIMIKRKENQQRENVANGRPGGLLSSYSLNH